MTEPNGGRDEATPASPTTPPATADTDAIATMGLDLQEGREVPRKQIISWAMWDWAAQPFNSVILTFIFAAPLYLTGEAFLEPAVAALADDDPIKQRALADLASGLGFGITIAGVLIAVLAPVLGQRADAAGRRKRSLAIATGLLVLSTAALFFVEAAPAYFALGVGLIAAGTVFSEIAGVNYNAMLIGISTPKTIGKVSGLGWGLGYIGGIVALVIVIVAYSADWFGLPEEGGLPFRLIAVGCALWTVLFSLPIFLNVPDVSTAKVLRKVNFFASYVLLAKDIVRVFRETRTTFWFLLASAVFRDGLAGVFTFGAVIAGQVFGFGFLDLVVFGIAANLVAGLSTILSGRLDDRFGARRVILFSLVGLVITGLAVFFLHDADKLWFWIGGLVLCLFVGPAQSASRSFLARVTPAGREGEIFGLYATTGRAASFLAPGLWTLAIALFGATYWGILGIVLVLLAGLVLMFLVREPSRA